MVSSQLLRQALACLDLTNLNDDCTEDDVRALCARARTDHGSVAAVCVWPRFVALAQSCLAGTPVRIATVVAFPTGMANDDELRQLVATARADGADEIDVVIPYQDIIAGTQDTTRDRVALCVAAGEGAAVKAILETGALNPAQIAAASQAALEGGAAFLKTSTGKIATGATPDAARIMLQEILRVQSDAGLKPSGGIATPEDAANYIRLCEEMMGPNWVQPTRFRIGASSLLARLIAALEGAEPAPGDASGY